MYYNRFQQGDSVQYAGNKEFLAKELNGKEGFVVSRVHGTEREVCVTFGDHAYIMDEQDHLEKFVRRARPENHDQAKGPEVQKRRGVSEAGGKGKGGKRRNQEEA